LKFFLSVAKYIIITIALSAIPFIARMTEIQEFHGVHTWTAAELKAQSWFNKKIRSDETILWCSGVSPDYMVNDSMPTAFTGVAIALSGLLLVGILSFKKQARMDNTYNVSGWLMMIFGAGLSTSPYWACGRALHTACALTDKRAIKIFATDGSESIPYRSSKIEEPFELSGTGESQTLIFYRKREKFNTNSDSGYRTGFKGISDGATALKILTEFAKN
jgi:hypothetical protein